MALPTTITGVNVIDKTAGLIGPFISSGGDVYVVFQDSAALGNLDIYKSVDVTTSFSQIATVAVDRGSGAAQEIFGYAVVQDGDNLCIGTVHRQTSPGDHPVLYHEFSMSSDSFTVSNQDTTGGGTIVDVDKKIDILKRAAGPVVIYNGPSESVMGQKQRVAYAERTSGVWTADIALDAGGEVDYFVGGGVLGASNKSHFTFKDDANSDAQHRSLTSGDVLSAVENFNDSATDTPDFVLFRPAYYDAAGTERITAAYKTATNIQASEIDNDGVPGAEEQVTDSAPSVGSDGQVEAVFAVDDTLIPDAVILGYIRASDDNVYLDNNVNSGGWGTDILGFTGTVTYLSGHVFERSGVTTFGYIVDDGGTIKYNELTAASGGGGGTFPATEASIVAGGATIIITLTGFADWVAVGATFDAQRQNIIDGMNSAQSELTGWNNEVRDKEVVTAVVRTSDKIVTITLTAAAAYDISPGANETITVTVPESALVNQILPGDLIVTPNFSVIAFIPIPGPTDPDPAASIAGNGLGGISRNHTPPGVIVNR